MTPDIISVELLETRDLKSGSVWHSEMLPFILNFIKGSSANCTVPKSTPRSIVKILSKSFFAIRTFLTLSFFCEEFLRSLFFFQPIRTSSMVESCFFRFGRFFFLLNLNPCFLCCGWSYTTQPSGQRTFANKEIIW